MKASDLKKRVQQHITSSNAASQLRAVSHRKKPFQTTHELIGLSHAFNYPLLRLTNNKLSSSTTGVNKTYGLEEGWSPCSSVPSSVDTSLAAPLLERGGGAPKQHRRPASPAGAGRAGAEGPQAGACPAALRCLVEQKPPQEQDQEVSVPTGHPGEQRHIVLVTGERGRWRPSALPFIASSSSSRKDKTHPCCAVEWEAPHLGCGCFTASQSLSQTQETAPRQFHPR